MSLAAKCGAHPPVNKHSHIAMENPHLEEGKYRNIHLHSWWIFHCYVRLPECTNFWAYLDDVLFIFEVFILYNWDFYIHCPGWPVHQ